MKINQLQPNENNPRLIKGEKFKKLVQSIKDFPEMLELRPIVIDEDNVILGGNMRYRACVEAGLKEVPVKIAKGLTEEQKQEFIVKDNVGFGEWDWDILGNDWDTVKLGEWGLDVWENEDDKEPEAGLIEDDEIPEVKESKVKRGDIWQLGEHRIMCGDSTSSDDVKKLMNKQKADLGLTDPPYNINYNYNTHQDNMTNDEYANFIELYVNNLILYSEKQVITSGKQNLKYYYNSFNITDFGVWYAKNKMSGSKISNLGLCEPILFIGKFNRNSRVNDMFEYNVKKQKGVGNHTCPKVLDFFLDIIKNYSEKIVLDVFLGSGTTLIACEKTNRVCYGMELDTKYCDVIIERWEQFTGLKAIKIN